MARLQDTVQRRVSRCLLQLTCGCFELRNMLCELVCPLTKKGSCPIDCTLLESGRYGLKPRNLIVGLQVQPLNDLTSSLPRTTVAIHDPKSLFSHCFDLVGKALK